MVAFFLLFQSDQQLSQPTNYKTSIALFFSDKETLQNKLSWPIHTQKKQAHSERLEIKRKKRNETKRIPARQTKLASFILSFVYIYI